MKVYSAVIHIFMLELSVLSLFIPIFDSKNFEDMSYAANMILTYFMNLSKTLNVIWQVSHIEELFKDVNGLIERGWMKREHIEKFQSQVTRAFTLFKVYMTASILTVLSGFLPPFYTGKLSYRMWMPFDPQQSDLLFNVDALYQLATSVYGTIMAVVTDMFPVLIMSYVVGFTEVLCCQLEELGREDKANEEEELQRLFEFMRIQIELKRVVQKLQKIFSRVLATQGVMSVVILCTTSFSLTFVSRVRGLSQ